MTPMILSVRFWWIDTKSSLHTAPIMTAWSLPWMELTASQGKEYWWKSTLTECRTKLNMTSCITSTLPEGHPNASQSYLKEELSTSQMVNSYRSLSLKAQASLSQTFNERGADFLPLQPFARSAAKSLAPSKFFTNKVSPTTIWNWITLL